MQSMDVNVNKRKLWSESGSKLKIGFLVSVVALVVVGAVCVTNGPQNGKFGVPSTQQAISTSRDDCAASGLVSLPIGSYVRMESQRFPGDYLMTCGTLAYCYLSPNVSGDAFEFKIVAPLLASSPCAVSFESKEHPGKYLTYDSHEAQVWPKRNVDAAMTYRILPGKSGSGVSLAPVASGCCMGSVPSASRGRAGCPKPMMAFFGTNYWSNTTDYSWTLSTSVGGVCGDYVSCESGLECVDGKCVDTRCNLPPNGSPMTGVWFQNNNPSLCMVIRGNKYGGFTVSPSKGIASVVNSWVSGAGFIDTSKSPISGQLSVFRLNHAAPFSFTFDLQSSDTEMAFHLGGSYIKQSNLCSCEEA